MRNPYELKREHSKINNIAGLHTMKQYVTKQLMLIKFAFSQACGEMRAIDWNVKFLQKVR